MMRVEFIRVKLVAHPHSTPEGKRVLPSPKERHFARTEEGSAQAEAFISKYTKSRNWYVSERRIFVFNL